MSVNCWVSFGRAFPVRSPGSGMRLDRSAHVMPVVNAHMVREEIPATRYILGRDKKERW